MDAAAVKGVDVVCGDQGAVRLHDYDAPLIERLHGSALQIAKLIDELHEPPPPEDAFVLRILSKLKGEVDERLLDPALGHSPPDVSCPSHAQPPS
ncbi:hypothetical protein [Sediminicoccus rosea]|uniref:Uncharacterized protein n=1 Tax=Sediminicoccus rosea TaxID=1225128 RepID=A0ABZ0PBW9_9PROT|nr:hypothetical protein [Sediminicoccus rosea]WPB83109.1 hypothetical protein R9Z33_13440 [Sediminicoccus rosea]